MRKRLVLFLPLILIIMLGIAFAIGLHQDPKKIASALIGKPIPEFHLRDLQDRQVKRSNLDLPEDEYFLVNVWGSWCAYCLDEFPFLIKLQQRGIKVIGLNYRDERTAAQEMLTKHGNPFIFSVDDSKGKFALDLGVDGAPETFLVNHKGIIVYRYSGILDEANWQRYFLPEIKNINK